MAETKMMGRVGTILAWVGFLGFFLGVFGIAPRTVMIIGLTLIVASLAAFFAEEFQLRGRF